MSGTPEFENLVKEAKRRLRHGDAAQAIDLFMQALALDDRQADLHEAIATAYFIAAENQKAVEHFNRAANLDPRRARPLVNLGAAYNRMGKFNDAVKALRKGLQKDRGLSEGFFNLGFAYKGLNQLSLSVSAYREAVRIDPNRADAHVNLANVYFEMGNNQQAIMHFKEALKIDPNFERAQRGLETAEAATRQAKYAISPFGRLVDEKRIGAKAVPQLERELTDTERLKDRQTVHGLIVAIEPATREFLDYLRDTFEPALASLGRASAHGKEAPIVMSEALVDYQTAVKKLSQLRQQLKRKLLELRAHEELINTPSLAPRDQ